MNNEKTSPTGITVACPKCKKTGNLDPATKHHKLKCRACGHEFVASEAKVSDTAIVKKVYKPCTSVFPFFFIGLFLYLIGTSIIEEGGPLVGIGDFLLFVGKCYIFVTILTLALRRFEWDRRWTFDRKSIPKE